MDTAGVLVARIGRLAVVGYPDGRHEVWDERMAVPIEEADTADTVELLSAGLAPGEPGSIAVILRLANTNFAPGIH